MTIVRSCSDSITLSHGTKSYMEAQYSSTTIFEAESCKDQITDRSLHKSKSSWTMKNILSFPHAIHMLGAGFGAMVKLSRGWPIDNWFKRWNNPLMFESG